MPRPDRKNIQLDWFVIGKSGVFPLAKTVEVKAQILNCSQQTQ
jgi:hypothetical protein